MSVTEPRHGNRGPSSPDLGQERPTDRVRTSARFDLGVREDDTRPPTPKRRGTTPSKRRSRPK